MIAPRHSSLLPTIALLALGWGVASAQTGDSCTAKLIGGVSTARLQADIQAFAFERSNPTTQAQASSMLQDRFASLGYPVRLDPVQTSENVVARIEGTVEPQRLFIVGAHFDSRVGSPGADDNGTGLAAVLEMARLLQDYRPEISVEWIGFALEEVGLVGSRQYAAQLAAGGIDVVGMISFDMIGFTCAAAGCQTPVNDISPCIDATPEGVDTGEFIVSGADTSSQDLQDLFAVETAIHVPDLPVVRYEVAEACVGQAQFGRSDHAPFWEEGFDAMLLSDTAEGRNPNYHQPSDLPATLDLSLVNRVTRATLATLIAAVGGTAGDSDLDGIDDCADNCPVAANAGQADFDMDSIGDVCETGTLAADVDLSDRVDGFDLAVLARAFGASCGGPTYAAAADLDRNCNVDGVDLARLGAEFGKVVP